MAKLIISSGKYLSLLHIEVEEVMHYLLNLPPAVILFAYIEPLVLTAKQSTIYQNTILNV